MRDCNKDTLGKSAMRRSWINSIFEKNRIRYGFFVVMFFYSCSVFAWPPAALDRYASKPDEWYRSEEGRQIAENILTWQDEYGSWPKNVDTKSNPYTGDRKELHGTFDNRATTGEMRFLARTFRATDESRYENVVVSSFTEFSGALFFP